MLSSWWNWYYGDSYGMRVMIDYYPALALVFGLSLRVVKRKEFMIVMVLSFTVLNVFQSYQYHHNIISRFDMNYQKYKYSFLKFGNEYENRLGGNFDIQPYHKDSLILWRKVEFPISDNNWFVCEDGIRLVFKVDDEISSSKKLFVKSYVEFKVLSISELNRTRVKLELLNSDSSYFKLDNLICDIPVEDHNLGEVYSNNLSYAVNSPLSIGDYVVFSIPVLDIDPLKLINFEFKIFYIPD